MHVILILFNPLSYPIPLCVTKSEPHIILGGTISWLFFDQKVTQMFVLHYIFNCVQLIIAYSLKPVYNNLKDLESSI